MNDNVVSRLTFELHVQYHIWCAVIHLHIIYSVVFTKCQSGELLVPRVNNMEEKRMGTPFPLTLCRGKLWNIRYALQEDGA